MNEKFVNREANACGSAWKFKGRICWNVFGSMRRWWASLRGRQVVLFTVPQRNASSWWQRSPVAGGELLVLIVDHMHRCLAGWLLINSFIKTQSTLAKF